MLLLYRRYRRQICRSLLPSGTRLLLKTGAYTSHYSSRPSAIRTQTEVFTPMVSYFRPSIEEIEQWKDILYVLLIGYDF